jgi:hypothetical protein
MSGLQTIRRRHPAAIYVTCGISALLVAIVAAAEAESAGPVDASTIMSRSIAANESDWMADPLFDRCEREDDGDDIQTHDVTMIHGRPYERLVAIGDRPLSASQTHDEQHKRQREIAQRSSEDANTESSYRSRHARFSALFQQFSHAFTFALDGRRRIAGRTAYHVIATPRPGYEPPTRDARALTGMTADFWVDVKTYHWIRLTARVTKPVSVVGLLVRLEPGTIVELEKAPMDDGSLWLMTGLKIQSSSRLLMLFAHHTNEDLRYFDFRRSSTRAESACRIDPQQN